MKISSRRVLLVAVASGGLLLGSAAPALAQPDLDLDGVTDQVSELTGSLQQEEDGPLQPVTDLVCSLTQIELLGECPGAAAAPQPVPEKPKPQKPVPSKPVGDKGGDKGGDGEAAPVGGVETGAGGTADDGAGLLLPLSVLGGAALTGGALVGARRLRGNQVS